MFHKFIVWAREHPIWLGVGVFVIGIILLYFIFRRKAVPATDSTGAYYAAQTAAQNAAAAETIAQQQANTQAIGINAQLAAANTQTEASRQVGLAQTEASRQVGLAQLSTGRDVNLAQIAATQEITDTMHGDTLMAVRAQTDYLTKASADAVTINAQDVGGAVNLAQIQASENDLVTQLTTNRDMNINATNVAGNVQLTQLNDAMTRDIAGYNASVANNNIAATRDIASYNASVANFNVSATTNAAMFIANQQQLAQTNVAQLQNATAAHLDQSQKAIATANDLLAAYQASSANPTGLQTTLEAIANQQFGR